MMTIGEKSIVACLPIKRASVLINNLEVKISSDLDISNLICAAKCFLGAKAMILALSLT